MMNHFIRNHTAQSEIFRRFAPLIASDLGVELDSEAKYEEVFNALPDLPGFADKLEPIKLMRWFSDNGRHKSECVSFWAVKMLLVDNIHGAEVDWEAVDKILIPRIKKSQFNE